jgi:hypothetical protein
MIEDYCRCTGFGPTAASVAFGLSDSDLFE